MDLAIISMKKCSFQIKMITGEDDVFLKIYETYLTHLINFMIIGFYDEYFQLNFNTYLFFSMMSFKL